MSAPLFWITHSPEHLFEKPTLLSAFFSVLLFWAISWALLGARQKMGALFWGLKRVHLLSRAFFLVGLLSRALFWGLFKGLSVHRNLNAFLWPISRSTFQVLLWDFIHHSRLLIGSLFMHVALKITVLPNYCHLWEVRDELRIFHEETFLPLACS